MHIREFDYHLPQGFIAQHPLPERDASRLLVVDRAERTISHRRFGELDNILRPGDLLVLNDTRVMPFRLYGRREGGGRAEVLLVEEEGRNLWWTLVKPGSRLRIGRRLAFAEGIVAQVVDQGEGGQRLLRFGGTDDIRRALGRIGAMPLPPYIKREGPGDLDRERYQTVFAREEGAIAAPTAGLHFTEALLDRLQRHGIAIAFLTLHVGVATFKPVMVEQVKEHRMEPERYLIPEKTAAQVKRAKADGRRVVAVGTTTTRALEDAALQGGAIRAGEGMASLFITPGYRFQVVDVLLTNFHLPRSTLLILVSAFAGIDVIRQVYAEAVKERYRFYSYGDATLIV
jgi:S-adenosylmethionine:tRNA ribosyltransferase-isomerase